MFAKSKNKHLASSSPIGGYKMIRWYEIWIYVYIYIMPFSYELSILGLVAAWSCHLPCFPKRLPSSKNSYHPEEPFDARPLERVTSGAQKISRPSEIRKKNLLQLQKTRICFLIFLKCFLCKKHTTVHVFCFFPSEIEDYKRVLWVEVTHSLRMMAREYVELKTLNTDHPLDHFVQLRSLSSADLTFSRYSAAQMCLLWNQLFSNWNRHRRLKIARW